MKPPTAVTLIVVFALAILAAPLAADAQLGAEKVPRLGYLWLGARGSDGHTIEGLRQGLRDLGYIEGQNVVIEYRYADGKPERLPDIAAELVQLPVDVMIAPGTIVTQAVQRTTKTTPVVSITGDPVGAGFVASFARPGGNITGLSLEPGGCETNGKRLQLLKEAFPRVSRVAAIVNPDNPTEGPCRRDMETMATSVGLRRAVFDVRRSADLDQALGAIAQERWGALTVATDPLLVSHRRRLVEFAAQQRLPSMYGLREFVDGGGLMAYSTSIFALWRRAAYYADRILKGAKPADLPIEQPTKFELVINLKTAKALGLTLPQSVLLRADEVIQ